MKYLFSTIVWGEDYAARFADFSLPTQLAAGNLDGFPDIAESTYQLFTRRADAERIVASAAWRRLQEIMATEVRYLDELPAPVRGADKYDLMSRYQGEVLKNFGGYDVVHFGYADLVWAMGGFAAAARRMTEGCDAVFAPGLPVLAGPFVDSIARASAYRAGAPMEITSRDLVAHTLANLHPIAKLNTWRSGNLSLAPAFQLWEVPGQGVVMRWFHLHPVFMRTRIDGVPLPSVFEGSLDEGFIPRALSGLERVHLMTDSDELAFCSLMPDWSPGRSQLPCNGTNLVHWAESYARFIHREFFKVAFRFHHRPIDPAQWEPVERQSAALAAEVDARLALSDGELRRSDLHGYWLRTRRGRRGDFWLGLAVTSGMKSIEALTGGQIAFLLLQRAWAAILAAGDHVPVLRRILRSASVRGVLARIREALIGKRE